MKDRSAKKVIVEGGENLTIKEAAKVFKISPEACQSMYYRGHDTLEKMKTYRESLKNGTRNKGGYIPKVFRTSKGNMTITEMTNAHKFNLKSETIRYRGDRWGYDHKCIWLPKLPPGTFKKEAIRIDGPPRPHTNDKEIRTQSTPMVCQNLNRRKACFRDKGRERCKHYATRLNMYDGHPEPCIGAKGDYCKNYEGQPLEVLNHNSGKPVRRYYANGTSTESP